MYPELIWREVRPGRLPGERLVRILRPHARHFHRAGPRHLVATEEVIEAHGGLAGLLARAKRVVIGAPLSTAQLPHEKLGKLKALAVFASDALSSVAYATEEILLVLILAGAAALQYSVPIALAIVALIAIVATSYRQTIRAYPQGGGTYIVTKDNLGVRPALLAAGALLIDYVLTVAVSISAGVAAITSAIPALHHDRVLLAVGFIVLMTLVNLRGVRESATVFALPTYLFIVVMLATIGSGLAKAATGALPPAEPPPVALAEPLTVFLLLRAFASGATALTGTEAIADGVPAFRPPESRNAATTLAWMAAVLATLFLGITLLARWLGVVPRPDETVVSQIARSVFGDSWFYYVVQAATMLILVLAANTAFADFPRLAYFLARDNFLPHQFLFRGDRLAFSWGIIALGALAATLVVLYHAETHALIPLYAVGVFISFTCSQSSMVRHWWRLREPGWRRSMAINAVGAATTGVVAVIIASTKFVHGAWMVLVLIPCLVVLMRGIAAHYQSVAEQLRLDHPSQPLPLIRDQPVVVPVSGMNQAVLRTLAYARSISSNVAAVHVTDDPVAAEKLEQAWQEWGGDVPLIILESPYRSLLGPLLAYIDAIDEQDPDAPVTVVLPEFVPRHWWEYLLHNQSALRIKAALFFRPNTVVVDVPYHLKR